MASDDIHEQLSADRAVAEPFLGREDLLTEFDQFMARATERKGGIFLLAGEPGSGKSRSIEEFAVRAENAGALVLSGSCPEHSSFGPFRPWVQILAHLSESATSPEQVRLFGNKQNLVHGLLNQPVTPPVSTDSSGIELMGQRFELFQTISSAFVQLADHSPLLLTLDDLHAADPSSLALLLHLAGFLRRHAILLIISYRDTEVPRKSAVAGALADLTRQGARRYRITGLGESNSYALTEALIGEPLPERWRRELYRQTSGNPLFITEIARAILQARAEGDGTLLVVGIPLGIQEAIGQQLDKFSRPCQRALEAAAVLGREFDLDLLAQQLTIDGAECIRLIEPALDAAVVEKVLSSAAGYRFRHGLFNEVLLDGMSATERGRLQLSFAELLERRNDPLTGQPLLAAAQFRLDSQAFGDRVRTVALAMSAAAECELMLAFEDADRFYAKAIEVLGADGQWIGADGVAASLRRARIAVLQAQYPRALSQLIVAVKNARALQDAGLFARCVIELICVTSHTPQRDAPELLAEAIALLKQQGGNDELLCLLQAHKPFVISHYSDLETVSVAVRSTVNDALRFSDPIIQAKAYRYGVMALRRWPAALGTRLSYGSAMLQLADDVSDIREKLELHYWHLLDLIATGDGPKIATVCARYRRLSKKFHSVRHQFQSGTLTAAWSLLRGDWSAAQKEIDSANALPLASDAAYNFTSSVYGVQMYLLQREQGLLPAVAEQLKTTSGGAQAFWKPGLLGILVETNQSEQARTVFDQLSPNAFAAIAKDEVWLTSILFCADACWLLQDTVQAELLYDQLEPWHGQLALHPPAAVFGAVDSWLGKLASLLKRAEDARRHFEVAEQLLRGAEAWPLLARALIDQVSAMGHAESEQMITQLDEAERLAVYLGMPVLIDRLSDLRKSAAKELPDGLTTRESEVLALLALGRSNKDIMKVLGISLSTTATHVRSILSKTGCANRTEAAAYALRHNL